MAVQIQANKPRSRAELLGQKEPDQVREVRRPGSPPTRAERLGKKPEVKYRITFVTTFLMIGTALFIDVLEMITTWKVIGVLLSYFTLIFVNLGFWTWFTTLGVHVGLASPKTAGIAAVTNLVGIIPGLDAIPLAGWEWTIGIGAIIYMARREDKTGLKLPTSPKKQ